MPYMPRTNVMMLGRIQPRTRAGFLNPPRTSPGVPQNLLRQTLLGGLGSSMRMLRGLGGLGQAVIGDNPEGAITAESAVIATDSLDETGRPFPGQSVPTSPAPIESMPASMGVSLPNVSMRRGTLGVALSLSLLSGAASAYHGWKRDGTPIAAWGWFTLGSMFPIVTPIIAVGQGYGKRRGRR